MVTHLFSSNYCINKKEKMSLNKKKPELYFNRSCYKMNINEGLTFPETPWAVSTFVNPVKTQLSHKRHKRRPVRCGFSVHQEVNDGKWHHMKLRFLTAEGTLQLWPCCVWRQWICFSLDLEGAVSVILTETNGLMSHTEFISVDRANC